MTKAPENIRPRTGAIETMLQRSAPSEMVSKKSGKIRVIYLFFSKKSLIAWDYCNDNILELSHF